MKQEEYKDLLNLRNKIEELKKDFNYKIKQVRTLRELITVRDFACEKLGYFKRIIDKAITKNLLTEECLGDWYEVIQAIEWKLKNIEFPTKDEDIKGVKELIEELVNSLELE